MTQKTHDITSGLNGFRKNLEISQRDTTALTSARAETRAFLRERFIPELRASVRNAQDMPSDTSIKFLTQGSFAYRTLNHPAHIPPQQMDLDDGIYFKWSDVQGIDSGELLSAMEKVLGEWAKKKGWKDVRKSNCCRAEIPPESNGNADKHIDWPIYAIRDGQENSLEEKSRQHREKYESLYQELGMRYYPHVSDVQLATKTKWEPSDPRRVIDWVVGLKSRHGIEFIHICRYLKAWRDYRWPKSPLSSIAIMVIVAKAFDERVQADYKEDDLLLCAVEYIDLCLDAGVYTVFDDNPKRLDEDITERERRDIQKMAKDLYQAIRQSIYGDLSNDDICALMRKHLGDRWPDQCSKKISPDPSSPVDSGSGGQGRDSEMPSETVVEPPKPWVIR